MALDRHYPGELKNLACPDCSSVMVLRRSKWGAFYGCSRWPSCEATHGAHQDSGAPLGVPASKPTREARVEVHSAFDALWEGLPIGYRSVAYGWLAEQLELTAEECHIGRFDLDQCAAALFLCESTDPEELVAWAKDRGEEP